MKVAKELKVIVLFKSRLAIYQELAYFLLLNLFSTPCFFYSFSAFSTLLVPRPSFLREHENPFYASVVVFDEATQTQLPISRQLRF